MPTIQLSPTGARNNAWRLRLAADPSAVPPRYARLVATRGALAHPGGEAALRHLLSCPARMDEDSNPWGDCDLLVAEIDGVRFFLKVDTYAYADELQYFSEDPGDDELTTRVYTFMLADEY